MIRNIRGISSAGRARGSQSRGRGFDPHMLHHRKILEPVIVGGFEFLSALPAQTYRVILCNLNNRPNTREHILRGIWAEKCVRLNPSQRGKEYYCGTLIKPDRVVLPSSLFRRKMVKTSNFPQSIMPNYANYESKWN